MESSLLGTFEAEDCVSDEDAADAVEADADGKCIDETLELEAGTAAMASRNLESPRRNDWRLVSISGSGNLLATSKTEEVEEE